MKIIKGSVNIEPKSELIEILRDMISIYDFKLKINENIDDYEIISDDMPFDLTDADFKIDDGKYKYDKNNKIKTKLIDYSNSQPSIDRNNDYKFNEYEVILRITEINVKNNKIIDVKFR